MITGLRELTLPQRLAILGQSDHEGTTLTQAMTGRQGLKVHTLLTGTWHLGQGIRQAQVVRKGTNKHQARLSLGTDRVRSLEQ